MPKQQSEDDKKHGDKLESLIDRTGTSSSGAPEKDVGGEEDDELDVEDEEEDEDEDE